MDFLQKQRTRILVEKARLAGFSISNRIYDEAVIGKPVQTVTFVESVRYKAREQNLVVRILYNEILTRLIIDPFDPVQYVYASALDNSTNDIVVEENYLLKGLVFGTIKV